MPELGFDQSLRLSELLSVHQQDVIGIYYTVNSVKDGSCIIWQEQHNAGIVFKIHENEMNKKDNMKV